MKMRKHLFPALLLKVFSLYVVEETQVISQSAVWRSCCFLPFPSIQLDCYARPCVWQMGRGFWVSYPCGWNLSWQIATELAVIAGLLNWQILPLNLGFIHFSIIMIYGSLFQTHETRTARLFQITHHSALLIAQETRNSIWNTSHIWVVPSVYPACYSAFRKSPLSRILPPLTAPLLTLSPQNVASEWVISSCSPECLFCLCPWHLLQPSRKSQQQRL